MIRVVRTTVVSCLSNGLLECQCVTLQIVLKAATNHRKFSLSSSNTIWVLTIVRNTKSAINFDQQVAVSLKLLKIEPKLVSYYWMLTKTVKQRNLRWSLVKVIAAATNLSIANIRKDNIYLWAGHSSLDRAVQQPWTIQYYYQND